MSKRVILSSEDLDLIIKWIDAYHDKHVYHISLAHQQRMNQLIDKLGLQVKK